jgi:CubicO group peptidase (beta-lactamase class C family)
VAIIGARVGDVTNILPRFYESPLPHGRWRATTAACLFTLCLGLANTHTAEAAALADEPLSVLETRIPALVLKRMGQYGVPGLSVAAIQGNRVVYSGAWGTANAWTHVPVTNDTIFDAASLGKPIAAYVALTLTSKGQLQLDAPLFELLTEPYLEKNSETDRITLRQVLSHTSGLPNEVWHRTSSIANPPGVKFSYSGNGFMYAQRVIESLTGRPFNAVAQEHVFAPFGMTSTSYVEERGFRERTANGHVPLSVITFYLAKFLLWAAAICLPAGILLHRLTSKRWWPTMAVCADVIGVSAATSLALPIYFLGPGILKLLGPIAAVIAGAILALAAAVSAMIQAAAGRRAWARYAPLACTVVSGLSMCVTLQAWTPGLPVPVPITYAREANAPSSLHASATDIARFFAEIATEVVAGRGIGHVMAQPVVTVSGRLSWGLGIGISDDNIGRALWQWGDNPGSQSLAIVYPTRGTGVVIMTNGMRGGTLARQLANEILGSDGEWSLH